MDLINPFINLGAPIAPAVKPTAAGAVPSRDIPMHLAYYRYLRADKTDMAASHVAAVELLAEINGRLRMDKIFTNLAGSFVASNDVQGFVNRPSVNANDCGECCELGHNAVFESCGGYGEYGMGYIKIVNNICALNGNSPSFGALLANKITTICA